MTSVKLIFQTVEQKGKKQNAIDHLKSCWENNTIMLFMFSRLSDEIQECHTCTSSEFKLQLEFE